MFSNVLNEQRSMEVSIYYSKPIYEALNVRYLIYVNSSNPNYITRISMNNARNFIEKYGEEGQQVKARNGGISCNCTFYP
jgi:uncharacterized protein (UPF0297 family)